MENKTTLYRDIEIGKDAHRLTKSADDDWYQGQECIVRETGEVIFLKMIIGGNFLTVNKAGEEKTYRAGYKGEFHLYTKSPFKRGK